MRTLATSSGVVKSSLCMRADRPLKRLARSIRKSLNTLPLEILDQSFLKSGHRLRKRAELVILEDHSAIVDGTDNETEALLVARLATGSESPPPWKKIIPCNASPSVLSSR